MNKVIRNNEQTRKHKANNILTEEIIVSKKYVLNYQQLLIPYSCRLKCYEKLIHENRENILFFNY